MGKQIRIERIWWRNVPPGEFFNVERHPKVTTGGQGSLYFEIPESIVDDTLDFLGLSSLSSLPYSINAWIADDMDSGVLAPIEFRRKSASSQRMLIARQNRQMTGAQRHPAWERSKGFPTAPSSVRTKEDALPYFPKGGLRIYIAKSFEGEYFAGFTTGKPPADMNQTDLEWDLYTQGKKVGGVIDERQEEIMPHIIDDVFSSWGSRRNVLLYGPPATGKTRAISQLFEALKQPQKSTRGIVMGSNGGPTPFSRPQLPISIPLPAKVVWTTFHQSYGYEDFVLGLRPRMDDTGTRLEPWAGVFLDAALELEEPSSKYESVVIFIDEINRGNAARIFGEFMTFLDFDYREAGDVPLPVPLRQLAFDSGTSEEIHRPGGGAATISEGFTFPKDVYIVATMNSVDRAAVPIDSALARRFDRIEMRPDLNALAEHWGLDPTSVPMPDDSNWSTLAPLETGYLLLDRLNVAIASDLGPEFELGHGLLTPISASVTDADGTVQAVPEDDLWLSLAKTWDDVLFPQLEDRYSGRPEQLMELLHVDSPSDSGDHAWQLRSAKGGATSSRTLAPVRVRDLSLDTVKRSFRWLTR